MLMRTRRLGNTGVLVTELGLGTMTFAEQADEATSHAILDRYFDAGGNFVDTADIYGSGGTEEIIGSWFGKRPGARDAIVLATKCYFRMREARDRNAGGLSRRWIVRACEGSLRRLGVDHVDLYQMHGWDPLTPLEESLAAFDDLVRAGKVRYVGVSNFVAWQLQRAILLARHDRLAPVLTLQPHYNLLTRDLEWEIAPLCLDEGIGIIPWSPLAQGWLTGKYRRGEAPAEGTRLVDDPNRGVEAYDRRDTEHTWRILDVLRESAATMDVPMAQVALRWLMDRPGVSTAPVGARTVAQLEQSLPAADLVLPDEIRDRLDEVSAPVSDGLTLYPMLAEWSAMRRRMAP
jgi:aryl-alcohol dehydrogenase-like predicted oxidoreductase